MKVAVLWLLFLAGCAVCLYFGQVADKQARRERDELRKWGGR